MLKLPKLAQFKRLRRQHKVIEGLALVNDLLKDNPWAAQLHLLKGELEQLRPEPQGDTDTLHAAETALRNAYELAPSFFNANLELMHFYDAVCIDQIKARRFALRVKKAAEKALADANEILHTK